MKVFDYPDVVATDDYSNKRLYDETVALKIPQILEGYSLVVLAYGQTGSGKTHTMIGKLGVFKNPPSENLDNLDENLGLFPRAALEILQGLKQRKEKTVMTIAMCESNAVQPIDLTSKGPIWLDVNSNEMMGGVEHIIESNEDIFKLGAMFESERSCGATKFNAFSSRSFAVIWIKIYTLVGPDKIRINHVKILDLAGSERVGQINEKDEHEGCSIMINLTLTTMSQIMSLLSEMKNPINDGKEIPRAIPWKWNLVTRSMKEGFNGLAFTSFIFCAQSHDHNSGETYATLIYGERYKKLKGRVIIPPPISISAEIQKIEKRIETTKKSNANIENSNRQQKKMYEFSRL